MGNLIRMDLYRMNKAKSFRVCLLVTFLLALLSTPLIMALEALARMLAPNSIEETKMVYNLVDHIANPASSLGYMLCLLSAVMFFYADIEGGFIKNIAGQMPKKGFTILSRFFATVPHCLVFMLAGFIGDLIGSAPFIQITVEGSLLKAAGVFCLKLLLLESICSILLLITSSFRNKSLGMILAVLLGLPVMYLIYMAINAGLDQVFKGANIVPYMPDQVLKEEYPGAFRALLVSAVTIGIFLPLSIRVFDKKDVK